MRKAIPIHDRVGWHRVTFLPPGADASPVSPLWVQAPAGQKGPVPSLALLADYPDLKVAAGWVLRLRDGGRLRVVKAEGRALTVEREGVKR